MPSILLKIIAAVLLLFLGLYGLILLTTLQPLSKAPATLVCADNAPTLKDSTFKVLSYNVQYMAGKNYLFWYEGDGDDVKPSAEDITITTSEVARIINDEAADFVLLQEINENDVRTYHRDQLQELQSQLSVDYPCYAESFYWQADFVPHPNIMGSVGMKLVTLSKYKIDTAIRHQLPIPERFPVHREFQFKRAVLETRIVTDFAQPATATKRLVLFNTHFDAWMQGTGIMPAQVAKANSLIQATEQENYPWLIGGDFNLLPPNHQAQKVRQQEGTQYEEPSPIAELYSRYQVIPSLADLNSPHENNWFTYFPNSKTVTSPDRTIDYLFFSNNLRQQNARVRQHDTWKISDHLPISGEFSLIP